MKTARSNLLGEYVGASEVEHADTHGFQIVCPCCDESVFKVSRPLKTGSTSDYFSHRKASPTQIEQCELRVSSMTPDAIRQANADSRGQTLALFLSHMRKALELESWCYGPNGSREAHKHMRTLPLMPEFWKLLRKDQKKLGVDDIFESEVGELLKGLETHGISAGTTFGLNVQLRIAKDIFRHLLTPEGEANHLFLFRHTAVRLSLIAGLARVGGHRVLPHYLEATLKGIFTKNPRKAKAILGKALEDTFAARDTDGFYRLMTMQMAADLLRAPYSEMLANHRAGLDLTEGLLPRNRPDAYAGMEIRQRENPFTGP